MARLAPGSAELFAIDSASFGSVRPVRRAIGFTPMETRRSVIVEASMLADELGFYAVQLPEAWGLDSTVVLTEVALATSTIRPMTSILSIWGRTPATIAMNAATLLDVSDGRYILGLGASTPALAEGFHDVEFAHPAARIERVVSEVANLLRGGRAELTHESNARPLKLGLPLTHQPEIMVAGMGPRMRQASATLASGWIPAFFGRDLLPTYIAELRQIRAHAGLDPNAFTVIVGPNMVVDPDLRRGRDAAASNLAWYIVAMGTYYADSLRMQGFADEVEAVIAANPRPKPGSCVIPSEAEVLMEQLSVVCTPEDASEALTAWDAIGDVTSVLLPPGLPRQQLFDLIRSIAPR